MSLQTGVFDRILQRARGKQKSAMYDLHPELAQRIPLMRWYSDEQIAVAENKFAAMAEFYQGNVWVHKAVKVWKDNIAPLPVRVVRGTGNDLELLEQHPITLLLANPNPEQGGAGIWQEFCVCLALGGEWGLEVVRSASRGRVLELWPRDPTVYTVKPGELGRRYRRVAGYKVDDGEGAPYFLTPEQFIHFKFYNPLNYWRGLAPITAVRMGVIIDQLSQAWSRLFFANQARPDFAVIAPEGITKSEREELELKLAQKHGGDNAHRPIVLEQGVTDIKLFSWAPKDLEWLEQRRFSRDEIGAVFGVPDEMMGYGKDTYENFNAADRVLWTLTLVPLAGFRDDVLTRFFRRAGALGPDERIATDLSGVSQLQEDKTAKINQLNLLAARGYPVNVLNEWLGLGLPQLDGGEVGYLPMGLVPVTYVEGGRPEPEETTNSTNETNEEESEEGDEATLNHEDREDGTKGAKGKILVPAYGSAQHEAIWKAGQARIDPFAEEMQRTVKREFQRQQMEVARKLRGSKRFGRGQFKEDGELPPVEELFDLEAEKEIWEKALRPDVERAVAALGGQAYEEVTGGKGIGAKDFDYLQESVRRGIRKILEAVAGKVNDTTWLDLIDIFIRAEQDGLGIPALQERLSDYFGDRKSDWQTERIARTTMTGAANFGSMEAWLQSGVVDGQTWISALIPDRTREEHAAAHGQTVKLGERFTVMGESLEYPGDPAGQPENIINCLCTTVPVVRE